MQVDTSILQEEAKAIVEQAARVYIEHTGDNFIGLIVHGSALKGGIIPGSSDIDLQLFLRDSAFDKNGMLPLEMYLKIHKDLANINTFPFSYIQCDAMGTILPEGYVGPVSNAYHLVAGTLPVAEATNEQLKKLAEQSLSGLEPTPKYFSTLLDHGSERLTRVTRLLCTQVSPTLYNAVAVSLEEEDVFRIWSMPRSEIRKLLPQEEMKHYAHQFYECVGRFYPNQTSVIDALEMIKYGSLFLCSVKSWNETRSLR